MTSTQVLRRSALWAVGLSLSALSAVALAQTRTIHLVVPYGTGAVQDTIARTFSNELGQALGATVVVENKPGAGGTVGTAQVAKSAPDGNTLVVAAASHHLAGHLYAKLPYDPIKDFEPVSLVATVPFLMTVNTALPVDRKSTRLNSSHMSESRMPSYA